MIEAIHLKCRPCWGACCNAHSPKLARSLPWTRGVLLGLLLADSLSIAQSAEREPSASCASGLAGDELFAWVRAQGGSADGVELRQEGAERSLVAQRDLPEGHAVLRLPVETVVTPQRAASTPLGRQLTSHADRTVQDLDGLLLTAWLLQQLAGEEPSWATYLASLPGSFPSLALNFTGETVHRCTVGLPSVESYLLNGQKALEREFQLFRSLPGAVDLGRDRFLWARFVTFSRTFTVPSLRLSADEALREGLWPDVATFGARSGEAAVFVPLADMINHAHGAAVNCRWRYVGSDAGFTVSTKRPVLAGEELLLSYGPKENKLFLAHYGFVDMGSPSDGLEVELRLPRAAPDRVPEEGADRLRLAVRGSEPATIDILQQVLEACRAQARLQPTAPEGGPGLEAEALRLILDVLGEEADRLRPSASCPDAVERFRENLMGLLATWGFFAEKALALLRAPGEREETAGNGVTRESWETWVGPYLMHARLYFGLWLRTLGGRRFVDEAVHGWEAMAEASEFGRVNYVDVLPELDFEVG